MTKKTFLSSSISHMNTHKKHYFPVSKSVFLKHGGEIVIQDHYLRNPTHNQIIYSRFKVSFKQPYNQWYSYPNHQTLESQNKVMDRKKNY